MPILHIHPGISEVDEPAVVLGLTILVSVQCRCGAKAAIGLLNSQASVCEACGATFSLDRVTWEKGSSTPSIALSSSPSRAKALLS